MTGKDFGEMCRLIRPYDVVLRRFDAYLDTGFIPGFWNHAGVVSPGMTILHAVAEGVREESLFDFMKADHICLLRAAFSFDTDTVDTRALDILSKEYDFDFDFENGDRLSCTELVRTLFDGFDHGIPISTVNYFLFSRKLVIPDTIVSARFETIYDSRWSHDTRHR